MTLYGLKVLIRGAGELASAVAHRLYLCHFKVAMTEIPRPLAVRRKVCFSEAVYEGHQEVEGVKALLVKEPAQVEEMWQRGIIPILVDPELRSLSFIKPRVLVDAIMAKRNLGTSKDMAELVIGLGPGFEASKDVHVVIETNRGHNLGRVIVEGTAEPDTGIPGDIGGYREERVLRAPRDGLFEPLKEIGDMVEEGEPVAYVGGEPVRSRIKGVIRGLLREGMFVQKGMKLGDVDPRGIRDYCFTISDKARAVAGGVLEAILRHFNREA